MKLLDMRGACSRAALQCRAHRSGLRRGAYSNPFRRGSKRDRAEGAGPTRPDTGRHPRGRGMARDRGFRGSLRPMGQLPCHHERLSNSSSLRAVELASSLALRVQIDWSGLPVLADFGGHRRDEAEEGGFIREPRGDPCLPALRLLVAGSTLSRVRRAQGCSSSRGVSGSSRDPREASQAPAPRRGRNHRPRCSASPCSDTPPRNRRPPPQRRVSRG